MLTRQPTRVLLAAAALSLSVPAAAAQGPDAHVVPRGMVEVRVLGLYTQFDELFGPNGREPLGSAFEALIAEPAERLGAAVADSTRARLAGFYTRTQLSTGGATPLALAPGLARARLSGDFRDVPVTVALGLTPRITVELSSSLHRRGTVVRGLVLEDASFGINPDPTRNNTILAAADSAYARLSGTYLPTRGSPDGIELQRRVRELTGDTLTLPTLAVPIRALLDDVPRAALDSVESLMLRAQGARTPYQLGDTYLGVRARVAGDADRWGAPFDSVARRGFRAVVGGRVRIPTGARAARLFPLQFPPDGGYWGAAGDVAADWFLSRRWWVTGAADAELLLPANAVRLAFSEDNPFPDTTQVQTVRREPGARFGASLTPRYRLTREIAFAAHYAFRHVGGVTITPDSTLALGPIETTAARTAHAVGVGMSYTTVAAYQAGDSPFPAEFSLLYRNVLAGGGYAPRSGSVEVSARLYTRVFGGVRRAAPDSAAAPPPAPPADTTRQSPPARPPVVPEPTPAAGLIGWGPRRW